jgi:hypothetical protein
LLNKLFQKTTLNTWHKNILKARGQGNFTAKWDANEYLQGKKTYPFSIRRAWSQFLLSYNMSFVQAHKKASIWLFGSHHLKE